MGTRATTGSPVVVNAAAVRLSVIRPSGLLRGERVSGTDGPSRTARPTSRTGCSMRRPPTGSGVRISDARFTVTSESATVQPPVPSSQGTDSSARERKWSSERQAGTPPTRSSSGLSGIVSGVATGTAARTPPAVASASGASAATTSNSKLTDSNRSRVSGVASRTSPPRYAPRESCQTAASAESMGITSVSPDSHVAVPRTAPVVVPPGCVHGSATPAVS